MGIFSLQSFEDVETWLKELKTNANPDIKVFLIGNKNDLEEKRRVQFETAEKFKNDYNLDLFLETSAKSGFNAQELFIKAGRILFDETRRYTVDENNDKKSIKSGQNIVKLEDDALNDYISNKKQNKKKNCC